MDEKMENRENNDLDQINKAGGSGYYVHSSMPGAGYPGGQPAQNNFTRQYYQNGGQPQPPKKGNGAKAAAFVAVFLAGAILFSAITGILVYQLTDNKSQSMPTETTQPLQQETEAAGNQDSEQGSEVTDKHFSIESASRRNDENRKSLSTMEIAALGRAAVVAISTEATITDIFGQTGAVQAAGSGFIISEDGYIVTNNHVIDNAQSITITLDSGEVSEAVLVGTDSSNDIAVLKVDGENLPTVTLGDSADLQIGELAVAIGNPLGRLSGTVTAGIISALDRSINIDGQTLKLLQTDAAINSGNSGGALFNSFGEVIGINTAKNAGTGVEGLGFAIPINDAKPIVESIINYGYVRGRTKLGIYTRDVTPQIALQNQLVEGVYIVEVEKNGAAEKAGLRQGDIIIALDDQSIKTSDELINYKSTKKPGDTLKVTFVRNGRETTADLVLEEDLPATVEKTSSVTDS
jgi:serine protease Do